MATSQTRQLLAEHTPTGLFKQICLVNTATGKVELRLSVAHSLKKYIDIKSEAVHKIAHLVNRAIPRNILMSKVQFDEMIYEGKDIPLIIDKYRELSILLDTSLRFFIHRSVLLELEAEAKKKDEYLRRMESLQKKALNAEIQNRLNNSMKPRYFSASYAGIGEPKRIKPKIILDEASWLDTLSSVDNPNT